MPTRTWSLVDTTVESLTISPREVTIRYPDQRRVAAIGSFSNGMQRDISRSVTWSSLDPSNVAVSGEVDDAGTLSTANVNLDAEIEATLDQDGTVLSDAALVHVFSSSSSTPSDP
jgi:hypothetical protein